jgi:hypothetical protein
VINVSSRGYQNNAFAYEIGVHMGFEWAIFDGTVV